VLLCNIRQRQYRTESGRLRNEFRILEVRRHIRDLDASSTEQIPGMEDPNEETA
jgi:hypothetical protein